MAAFAIKLVFNARWAPQNLTILRIFHDLLLSPQALPLFGEDSPHLHLKRQNIHQNLIHTSQVATDQFTCFLEDAQGSTYTDDNKMTSLQETLQPDGSIILLHPHTVIPGLQPALEDKKPPDNKEVGNKAKKKRSHLSYSKRKLLASSSFFSIDGQKLKASTVTLMGLLSIVPTKTTVTASILIGYSTQPGFQVQLMVLI